MNNLNAGLVVVGSMFMGLFVKQNKQKDNLTVHVNTIESKDQKVDSFSKVRYLPIKKLD